MPGHDRALCVGARYAPPQEFVDAVFGAPDPSSYEYHLSCARFHPALNLKNQAIREVVCFLRTRLGRHTLAAYPSNEDGPAAIWIGDYNLERDQARLRIEHAGADRFGLQLGHGPFHEQERFTLARSYSDVPAREIVGIIQQNFELPDR